MMSPRSRSEQGEGTTRCAVPRELQKNHEKFKLGGEKWHRFLNQCTRNEQCTLTEILKTFRPFKTCSLVQPDDGGDVV